MAASSVLTHYIVEELQASNAGIAMKVGNNGDRNVSSGIVAG
ncbi:hypothetical protein [Pseudopelagicola sp. nBUS_19]